ncbi:hypothetical protein NBRC116591_30870 [Sessilibacter corallicola]|uniref:Uncharacterized protein n=1 Tax=Sessilibacter corallicola TaxID=2904075 RepID=A0ABQ0ACA5_9GAMM
MKPAFDIIPQAINSSVNTSINNHRKSFKSLKAQYVYYEQKNKFTLELTRFNRRINCAGVVFQPNE